MKFELLAIASLSPDKSKISYPHTPGSIAQEIGSSFDSVLFGLEEVFFPEELEPPFTHTINGISSLDVIKPKHYVAGYLLGKSRLIVYFIEMDHSYSPIGYAIRNSSSSLEYNIRTHDEMHPLLFKNPLNKSTIISILQSCFERDMIIKN